MSSFQGGLAKIILAHELTHALDDQLFDIDGTLDRLAGNADAQMAYQAVVEGSGTSTMNQWMLKHIGKDLTLEDLTGASEMDTGGLEKAPAALWKPMLMVYLRGAAFLVRSDNVGVGQMKAIDRADLERAFTRPPRSTEQILHPEKYWDPEQLDEPVQIDIDTSALEATGWKLVNQETLGEATLALVTSPEKDRGGLNASNPFKLMGTKYTNRDAEGWGGDRYVLLEKDGVTFIHLTTLWDTEKDAEEFQANLEAQGEKLTRARQAMTESGLAVTHIFRAPKRVDLTVLLGSNSDDVVDTLVQELEIRTVLVPPIGR
jgi:hypothetical protein